MPTDLDERLRITAQTALRIAAGLAYFSHATQKLFGWFGGFGPEHGAAELMSRFGLAGALETVFATCLILGLFTRAAAFLASGEMAVTYFWIHWGGSGKMWGGRTSVSFRCSTRSSGSSTSHGAQALSVSTPGFAGVALSRRSGRERTWDGVGRA